MSCVLLWGFGGEFKKVEDGPVECINGRRTIIHFAWPLANVDQVSVTKKFKIARCRPTSIRP